ncbi:MAG: hypothetical protein GY774_34670 [Planctomycetes bacterium]|nr:hypothetical protein [Planctomycetota bacterium]
MKKKKAIFDQGEGAHLKRAQKQRVEAVKMEVKKYTILSLERKQLAIE